MEEQPKTSVLKTASRFCRIALYGSLGIFAAFCALYVFYVHFKTLTITAEAFRSLDVWFFLSLPALVCLGGAAYLRDISIWWRVPLAIVAALLASIFGIVLVATLGFWFHAVIGGAL